MYYLQRILPESIRWSVTKGRLKEAMTYAAKIARFNKIELPEDFSINPPAAEKEEHMDKKENAFRKVLTVITKKKAIRRRAICMPFIWLVEYLFLLSRE